MPNEPGWLRRTVADHLDWIDAHSQVPRGRLSPQARIAVVYVTAAACLIMISYGVLSEPIQANISYALQDLLDEIWPGAEASLRPFTRLMEACVWALGCFTFYFLVPALVVRTVLGQRLRDYGLGGAGYLRHLKWYLVMYVAVAALVLLAAQTGDFQRQYPFYRHPHGIEDLLIWEAFYALQFFALEFFFRGFLLHGVKDKLGRYAIFAAAVPYTMIHFSKPMFETFGAIAAGLVLGAISLRTRNIWGGFTIHVAVAITMDVSALLMREESFTIGSGT